MTALARVLPVAPPAVTPIVTTPANPRGRVYVFHGLNGDPTYFNTAPNDALITGLVADRWQTVVVGEMYDGASQASSSNAAIAADGGHGSVFRAAVEALHVSTRAWVEAIYGPPPGRCGDALLGISWGGLMVELLSLYVRPIRAFCAHLPATDPSFLTEFSGTNTSGVLPSLSDGVHSVYTDCKGWISYSTSDTRVGYTATQTLAATLLGANPRVTIRGGAGDTYYQALGHSTDATVVADMVAFMRGVA